MSCTTSLNGKLPILRPYNILQHTEELPSRTNKLFLIRPTWRFTYFWYVHSLFFSLFCYFSVSFRGRLSGQFLRPPQVSRVVRYQIDCSQVGHEKAERSTMADLASTHSQARSSHRAIARQMRCSDRGATLCKVSRRRPRKNVTTNCYNDVRSQFLANCLSI